MDPSAWQWIWLIATGFFIVGEIAMPGSFFLLPFGCGTALATVFAFAGVNEGWQWAIFLGTSVISLAGLRPLARRLNKAQQPSRVGANRLIGETGVVIEDLDKDLMKMGLIRVGREEWHAETFDGSVINVGNQVEIIEIEGTRAIVKQIEKSQ